MNTKQKLPAAGLPKGQWVMVWGAVLAVATVAFLWNLFVIVRDTNRDAGYLEIVGNLRVLSQQIGSSARVSVGRHVGLGAQYKHYTYSYDRGILASKLGGEINFEGFQLFASFLF